MKRLYFLAVFLLFIAVSQHAYADGTRIGVGANYWTAVDDIDVDNIDDDGFSYTLTYQYWPEYLGFEVDFEMLPDKYGEKAFAPQAFILLGKNVYGGAGIGIEYRDSELADEPFFAFRAGLNLEVLPHIWCDIYATYRFNESADMDDEDTDIDSDTVFLGATVLLEL